MAYFPFMINLDDKKCLVAGGGKVAYRKALQMSEFGAKVFVVAPDICDDLKKLEKQQDNVCLFQKKMEPSDIEDMDVVVMATSDNAVNSYYAALCKEKKILVNVVDVKKDCGFYFPAIVRQGEVVVGVSTGGCSPLLASHIKQEIQSHIRPDYGKIADEMEDIREAALENIEDDKLRKQYLKEELMKKLRERDL